MPEEHWCNLYLDTSNGTFKVEKKSLGEITEENEESFGIQKA